MDDQQCRPNQTIEVECLLSSTHLSPLQYHTMIDTLTKPTIFKGMIENWESRQWSPQYFADNLGQLPVKVKIGPKCSVVSHNSPIFETDCCYETCTMQQFHRWLNNDGDCGNLSPYKSSLCWCYVDYHYMAETFKAYPAIRQSIDWSKFGFHERFGDQSTFWMGSQGANTPCHYDTYGYNLVAQLYGRKKWLLVAPDQSQCMYPIRVPYEESSVFSSVDVKSPNLNKHPKFADATIYQAILEPGDVLFVPKHWWHDVECLETAISVNTWIELPSDDVDRLCEAITRTMVFALKSAEGETTSTWLNPSEIHTNYQTNIGYIRKSLELLIPNQQLNVVNEGEILNGVINSLLSPDMIKTAADRYLSLFTSKKE